jgi:hypothetical protein
VVNDFGERSSQDNELSGHPQILFHPRLILKQIPLLDQCKPCNIIEMARSP